MALDEEELALVWTMLRSSSLPTQRQLMFICAYNYMERPLIPAVVFRLDDYPAANCELMFRFNRDGIRELFVLLRIPGVIITDNRDRVNGIEALCIMLYRLRYPRVYFDMMTHFGRSIPAMSRIFLHMIDLVHDTFADVIFMAKHVLQERIQDYCDAIYEKGAPLDSIFGFIDGTKVAICRPSPRPRRPGSRGENLQRQCYSGHKRIHCFNYQGVTAPDGMCIHFWGPIEGRRHDSAMLHSSKLLEYFRDHPEIFDGRFIYGDPAYGVQRFIVSGFKGNLTDPHERDFNKVMSSVRESVEWNFKEMKSRWQYIDFKKQQKARLQPVGKFVKVAMLLTNCHNCWSGGNQICQFFGMTPPTMRSYLS